MKKLILFVVLTTLPSAVFAKDAINPPSAEPVILTASAALSGKTKVETRKYSGSAISTATVVLCGKTVFVVSERLLSLSAQERAERISQRI